MSKNQVSNNFSDHVISGFAFIKDEDNNIKTYNSVIHDKVIGKKPEPVDQDIKNSIIENIEGLVFKIGFFSSRLYNYDDFDNVPYSEDDIISNKLIMAEMVGYHTPYDLVIFHRSNEWKYKCLNIEFELIKNLISIMNTNFPRIINIPRSNGTIQKALIPTTGGIVIRKSVSLGDENDRLYIRVIFDEYNESEISDENKSNLKSYKDIPIEIIIKHNPEIREFKINHYLFKESDYNVESELTRKEIKNGVLEYYDNKKNLWILDKLNPVISRLENIVKITNIIH